MKLRLTGNNGLKVVAVILATALWFYVNNITSERRVIEGVRIESLTAPQLTVQRMNEPTVNVILRGSHGDLWQITRSDLSLALDLRGETSPGKFRVTLSPEFVRHPQRVQVVQIMPAQLFVWLVYAPSTNSP